MPRYKKNKQLVGDAGVQTTKSKSTSTKHKQKVKYSKSDEKIKSVEKSDGSRKQVIKNNPNYGGKTTVSKTSASGEKSFKVKGKSPMQMNRYDKDMMHERELIHDAKGQIHKADKAYKKGDKGKKQEMIHDREMIYDAKTDIHKIDVLKHSRKNRRF